MAEKFLTFEQARAELGISAENLHRLMDGKELACIVEGGVVKFRETDVLALKAGGAGRSSGQACGLHRQAPKDYGFVFLVDEDEEESIEGNRYDGDLPVTLEVPKEAKEEDVVQPVELSADQEENLDIFSQLDLAAAIKLGREVAQRQKSPEEGAVPATEVPAPATETVQSEAVETPQVSEPEPEPSPTEPAPKPHEPEPTPVESVSKSPEPPSEEPGELEAPTLIVDQPEPDQIETDDEVITQLTEPKEPRLDFTVEDSVPPETPTPPSTTAETFETEETEPEPPVTENMELATDEESQELPPVTPGVPSTQSSSEPGEPTPPTAVEIYDTEPRRESTPEQQSGPESCALTEDASCKVCEAEPEPLTVVQEESATQSETDAVVVEEESRGPMVEEVVSVSEWPAVEEPVVETEVEPESEVPPAVVQTQAQTTPSQEEIPAPGPEESKESAQDILDEIMREVEEETAPRKTSPDVDKEESVATDDQKKDKGEKPEEDVFEVYDIEEEKTEKPQAVPQPKAPEEEIVELEEVSEEKAALERSIEEEMADLFGEGEAKGPQTVEPAESQTADDFDLSIFKEGGKEVPAMEEADLGAMTETPTGTPVRMGGVSRIEALQTTKGPSTIPWTALILIGFTIIAVGMMVLMALASGVGIFGR